MKLKSEFDATCPCCHSTLVIDTNLRRIVRHEEPPNPNRPELSDAHRLIAEEAARREGKFQESVAVTSTLNTLWRARS